MPRSVKLGLAKIGGREAGSCWVGLLNVVGMHKSFGLSQPLRPR